MTISNSDRARLVCDELFSITTSASEICKIAAVEEDIPTSQIMALVTITLRIMDRTIFTALSETSPRRLQLLAELLETFNKTLPTNKELLVALTEKIDLYDSITSPTNTSKFN